MIVDLQRFLISEERYWKELEKLLTELETRVERTLSLEEAKRFHYLYQRVSSDLVRLAAFPSEPGTHRYLESLVSRAYAEIHETRDRGVRFSVRTWFFQTFPQVFRKHAMAFALAVLITLAGASFGGFALSLDPDSKDVLMPFSHLQGDPSQRVAYEESREVDHLEGRKGTFSAFLMTHNTRVSIFTMALGMTWGIGTIIMLFYNGTILGAVVCDYVLAGEVRFLAGWLLPHGAIEIPAILIAGQAGLVLGKALIGWGTPISLKARLRQISGDLVTLICGVAALLVWAGLVEAFFSQYHEPVIPYSLKTTFGLLELILLTVYLMWSGRKRVAPAEIDR
ncbi:MAG: stage II sporulation protein M [Candidatus Abyssobacteria bacterium SURF_5]|uniref:Stage II sporulation protein M n=1 Tax=Abyssobacteria bacterium (strain SURF_5) TaxID=2093360 RepID=A0A3A4NV42_ABYX5|nr:MAG: stage II sporulation protein M [Candidatus Abyssubacteria bacterium SURF_5]